MTEWVDQTRLVASDASQSSHFGTAVALSTEGGVTTAVIGSPNEQHPFDAGVNPNPGAAYVFTLDAGAWMEQQKVSASDGLDDDHFGWQVSISANTMVVGAPALVSGQGTGAVYVFVRAAGMWTEAQKLTASDAMLDDYFGHAVSLDGDQLIVGAPARKLAEWDRGNGAVYVFTRSAGVFTETQKLTASDGELGDAFGSALAMSGSSLVVGALWESDTPASVFPLVGPGAVYFFEQSGGTWSEQQKLRSSDMDAGVNFGTSVAMHGATAIVSDDYASDTVSGAAYVFERVAGIWSEQQRLSANAPRIGGRFGWHVAAGDDVLIVSSLASESAFLYMRDGSLWTEQIELTARTPGPADRFGRSIAVAGGLVLIGAIFDDQVTELGNEGAVFARVLVGGACTGDASCGADLCVDGFCCDVACDEPCAICNQPDEEGHCKPAPHGVDEQRACAPFVCDGVQLGCPVTCNFDSDCATNSFCELDRAPPVCQSDGARGATCAQSDECVSGICEDNVCCESTCPGACSSCDVAGLEGTCAPVPAGQPGGCAPLVCNGVSATCPDGCVDDSACPEGFLCDLPTGTCTDGPTCDGHTVTYPDRPTEDCRPYRCNDTKICLTSCRTSAECATSFVCGSNGKCTPAPSVIVRNGCACATTGRGGDVPWSFAWFLLGLLRRSQRGRS